MNEYYYSATGANKVVTRDILGLPLQKQPGVTTLRYRKTRAFLIHLEEEGDDLLQDRMKGEYWQAESAARAARWFLLLLATLRQTFGDHPLVAQLISSRTQHKLPTHGDLQQDLLVQMEILAQALEQLPDLEVGPGSSVTL